MDEPRLKSRWVKICYWRDTIEANYDELDVYVCVVLFIIILQFASYLLVFGVFSRHFTFKNRPAPDASALPQLVGPVCLARQRVAKAVSVQMMDSSSAALPKRPLARTLPMHRWSSAYTDSRTCGLMSVQSG